MINPDTTLQQLSLTVPGATGVFQDYGLDFCCGGAATLRDAAAHAHIPLEEVVSRLEREASPDAGHGGDAQWDRFSVEDLVRHVLDTYHAFTHEKLQLLPGLMKKVVAAHGERHPEVHDVAEWLDQLVEDLEPHMQKEERMLFPFAVALDRAIEKGGAAPRAPFPTAAMPIRTMESDHRETGRILDGLRSAANGFAIPAEACATFRAAYAGLDELVRDVMLHVHFEENILFPRVLELEAKTRRSA